MMIVHLIVPSHMVGKDMSVRKDRKIEGVINAFLKEAKK